MDNNNTTNTWSLAATVSWSVFIFILFLVTQSTVFGFYVAYHYQTSDEEKILELFQELEYDGVVISLCTFASMITCSAAILIIMKLKKGSNLPAYIGLNLPRWFTTFKAIALFVLFIIALDCLSYLFKRDVVHESMLKMMESSEPPWLIWLAIVIAAPFFEELFFRSFLITSLKKTILGPFGAILLSSLFWASIHLQYDLINIGIIFTLGLILGNLYHKSQSFYLVFILHATNNFLACLQTSYVLNL